MAKKIQDFGEKIGGARKDMFAGLSNASIQDLSADEKLKLIRRDKIWPKIDPMKDRENGVDMELSFWRKMIRDSIFAGPRPDDRDEAKQTYVNAVIDLRDKVMASERPGMIEVNGEYVPIGEYITPKRSLSGKSTAHLFNPWVSSYGSYYFTDHDVRFGLKRLKNKFFEAMISPEEIHTRYKESDYGLTFDEKKEKVIDEGLKVLHFTDNVSKTGFCYEKDGINVSRIPGEPDGYVFTMMDKDKVHSVQKKVHNAEGLLKTALEGLVTSGGYTLYNMLENEIVGHFTTFEQATEKCEKIKQDCKEQAKNITEPEKAKGKERKKSFVLADKLENFERSGAEDFTGGRDITGDDLKNTFGFRGGEYGNWLTDKDRQASLNMSFNALCDLANILGIPRSDISLPDEKGNLAIAYGARGISKAAAHFEPAKNVINLTKMNGAGCLAHEWAHALDHHIARMAGIDKYQGASLASDYIEKHASVSGVPASFKKLIKDMQYKTVDGPIDKSYMIVDAEKWEKNVREFFERDSRTVPGKYPDPQKEAEYKALYEKLLSYPKMSPEERALKTPYEMVLDISRLKSSCDGKPIPSKYKDYFAKKIKLAADYRDKAAIVEVRVHEVETDFYKNSQTFDGRFSKTDHGYWASPCEMFARLMACYVQDKLADAGIKSEYLSSHADSYNKDGVYAVPMGEERQELFKQVDQVLIDLNRYGILHGMNMGVDIPMIHEDKAVFAFTDGQDIDQCY